jgi:hypothetical protein
VEALKMTMKLQQPEQPKVRQEVQKYLEPVTVAPMAKSALPDISSLTPEQRELLKQML